MRGHLCCLLSESKAFVCQHGGFRLVLCSGLWNQFLPCCSSLLLIFGSDTTRLHTYRALGTTESRGCRTTHPPFCPDIRPAWALTTQDRLSFPSRSRRACCRRFLGLSKPARWSAQYSYVQAGFWLPSNPPPEGHDSGEALSQVKPPLFPTLPGFRANAKVSIDNAQA